MEVLYGVHPVEEALKAGKRRFDHVLVAPESATTAPRAPGRRLPPGRRPRPPGAARAADAVGQNPRPPGRRRAGPPAGVPGHRRSVRTRPPARRVAPAPRARRRGRPAEPWRAAARGRWRRRRRRRPHRAPLRAAEPRRRQRPAPAQPSTCASPASSTSSALSKNSSSRISGSSVSTSAAQPTTTSSTSPATASSCWAAKAQGLHDLVRRTCDHLLRIPMAGGVSSLNVSAAGAVVLYEASASAATAARSSPPLRPKAAAAVPRPNRRSRKAWVHEVRFLSPASAALAATVRATLSRGAVPAQRQAPQPVRGAANPPISNSRNRPQPASPGGKVIFSRSIDENGQTTTTGRPRAHEGRLQPDLLTAPTAEDAERDSAVTFTDLRSGRASAPRRTAHRRPRARHRPQ